MNHPLDARLSCTQRAYLHFAREGTFGDPPHSNEQLDQMTFDPNQVTALVGLSPTNSWRRGDVNPNPAFPGGRRFSTWAYEIPAEQTYITEDVLTRLLDVIEPHADKITNTCRTLQMKVGIMLVIEMEGYHDTDGEVMLSTAATGCTSDTIKRLAHLNLSVEHDQYVNIS